MTFADSVSDAQVNRVDMILVATEVMEKTKCENADLRQIQPKHVRNEQEKTVLSVSEPMDFAMIDCI